MNVFAKQFLEQNLVTKSDIARAKHQKEDEEDLARSTKEKKFIELKEKQLRADMIEVLKLREIWVTRTQSEKLSILTSAGFEENDAFDVIEGKLDWDKIWTVDLRKILKQISNTGRGSVKRRPY